MTGGHRGAGTRLHKTALFVAAALVAFLSLSVYSESAHAHAVLLGSDPVGSAALDTSPERITLSFNENVGPIFLKVLDGTGSEVGDPGAVGIKSNDIWIDLNTPLTDGTYIVTYRVVSQDTHPVGGSFVFTVGDAAPVDTAALTAGSTSQKSAWWMPVSANRTLQFAALMMAVGLGLFGVLIKAPANVLSSARSLGVTAAIVAAVTFVAAVALGGAEMLDVAPGGLLSAQTWSQGQQTTLWPSLWLGLAGLALLIAGLIVGFKGAGRAVILLGAVVSVGSLLVTGHAATADPRWFMTPIVGLHVLAVAFWFGSLLPLIKTVRTTEAAEGARVLNDFSVWAIVSVVVIILSGIGISFIQVENVPALLGTEYGNRLLIKLGLVVALLGLAGANKLWLTPALADGTRAAAGNLRTTISFEIVAIFAIFGLATSLSLSTPPRALADQQMAMDMQGMDHSKMDMTGGQMTSSIEGLIEQSAERAGAGPAGFKEAQTKMGYTVDILVTPARTGQNTLVVTLTTEAGEAFTAVGMKAFFSLPSAGLEPQEFDLEETEPGIYEIDFGGMIIPGDWRLRLETLVTDFDKVKYDFDVPVSG